MKKGKVKTTKTTPKNAITATAKCACFDIEISAAIKTRNLTKEETMDVKRKLKHQLTNAVSKLPFAHVYPHEVTFT